MAVPAYKEEYGVDPSPVLFTDYMTEELSDLDSGTEEQKEAHRALLRRQARLTEWDIENKVVALEVVKLGFLSEEVRVKYYK